MEVAITTNSSQLPSAPSKTGQIKLPAEEYCVMAPNYQVAATKKRKNELNASKS